MIKNIWKFIKDNYKIIFIFIIFAIIFLITISVIISAYQNTQNKISEGEVIDKNYAAGYTEYIGDKSNQKMISQPPKYYIKLRGIKNEYLVDYWCEVTENDYNSVKIGDYFKR